MAGEEGNSGKPRLRFWSSSRTVTGNVRSANEDSVLDLPAAGLWVVADGMGGHNAGDVASRMVVDALADVRPTERPSQLIDQIEDRILEVNRALHERSMQPGAGLSGTTVVALVAFDRFVACLWAGDSRVYRMRGTALEQLTRDHSEVQEFADQGRGAGEAAQNVITRAVGGFGDLQLDLEIREVRDGDAYLLCSDGLYRELSDQNIAWHLRQEPAAAATALIDQALSGTCADNVSAIVVRCGRNGPPSRR